MDVTDGRKDVTDVTKMTDGPPSCKSRFILRQNLDFQHNGLNIWQCGRFVAGLKNNKSGAKADSHPGPWTMVNALSKKDISEKKLKWPDHLMTVPLRGGGGVNCLATKEKHFLRLLYLGLFLANMSIIFASLSFLLRPPPPPWPPSSAFSSVSIVWKILITCTY